MTKQKTSAERKAPEVGYSDNDEKTRVSDDEDVTESDEEPIIKRDYPTRKKKKKDLPPQKKKSPQKKMKSSSLSTSGFKRKSVWFASWLLRKYGML